MTEDFSAASQPSGARAPGASRATINLRADPQLREQLDHAAAGNHRSLSAEIEDRLRRSFASDDPISTGPSLLDTSRLVAPRLASAVLAVIALGEAASAPARQIAAVVEQVIAIARRLPDEGDR
jgi:hypothetical protein